ncbi:NACHT, LRR and PYD domains-containing protein 5-like [Mustelus asterias]
MANPLCITLLSLLFLQQFLFGEGSSSRVNGVSGKDILLPCTFPIALNFRLKDLVITWQRTLSSIVVHSFYSVKNHPEYQDSAFRGRTELFPQEFHIGNATLRLKGATMSDQGNYTCFVIQQDGNGYLENVVELELYDEPLIPGIDDKNPALERKKIELPLGLSAGTLIILIAVGFGIRKKQNRKQQNPEKMPLLVDAVEDAIRSFKEHTLRNTDCFDKMSHGTLKNYSSLARTVKVTSPKKQDTLDDILGAGASDIEREVKAAHLLSLPQEKNCSSKRVLLVGDAGVGKSWAVSSIQQEWAASQPSQPIKCIIVFRFCDFNDVEGKTTLQELFKKHCEPLSSVLTELLCNPQDVLIILDGLDEFSHQLQWNALDDDFNIDSEAEVNILVSRIISKHLLPTAQVLVTSRWNTKQIEAIKKYFDCMLIISGFTNDQLRRYCEVFYQGGEEKAGKMYQHITENETINCLTSNPLNSYILCSILDRCSCNPAKIAKMPMTHSKIFLLFLYSLVNSGTAEESVITIDKSEPEQKLLKDTILKLGELSFHNLLSGKLEMKTGDLGAYEIDPNVLSKYFSNLILEKKCNSQRIFEFQHVVLKEQFAALYCATSLTDDAEELIKCLDLWCFGKMPLNQKSQYYLRAFKPEHTEKMYNFTRLLMGSLTAGRDGTLWNCSAPLSHSTARALISWFKNHLEREMKSELLNLMRCLFELHDSTVTAAVSPHIKNVNFFNNSLSPLDLAALSYCLSHSTVDKLDLRLCTLGDDGIKQLKEILSSSKYILVSANRLTEKSAKIFSDILKGKDCVVEKLSIGTNILKSGVQMLFEALKSNKSLKSLYLYHNEITDDDTVKMSDCLKQNETLKILHLCGNKFGEPGLRNIQQLKKQRTNLKIITYITEDEELIDHVYKQIEETMAESMQYDTEWISNLLDVTLKNLEEGMCHITNQHTQTKVDTIKANIQKLQKKLSWNKQFPTA